MRRQFIGPLQPIGTQKKCPYYGVSLLSGLILRKMYGVGQTKLSVITNVRIKRVSVKRGSTAQFFHLVIARPHQLRG